ncbi:MAG: alpha-galactosidase [Clostridia bacterium]|nr:alpha-galactosidase [Clostridia bacterium]
MKTFVIKYKAGNKIITTNETENSFYSLDIIDTDERFTVTLNPKKTFELVDFYVEFPYVFKDNDKFFAAGYQSWTVTKEMIKTDIQKGTIKLANIHKKVKYIASMTSDERIVEYSEKPGEFHSHGYTYVRNGDNLKLWGSLSENTGFSYFKVKMNDNYFSFRKDVLGKFITQSYKVFDVVYFEGGYDEVFDKYFALMDMPETRNGSMSGYTSWYNYFQDINEEIILRDLNGLDPAKEEVSIFQIDDGYETFVGDWIDPNPSRFPHGMGYIADKIHEKGYKAGIWLAPFSCQKISRIAKEHPDWLVQDENGVPYQGCLAWGGAYILDVYNEEVREYLRKVFDVVLNEWKFDMVKLDFLYSECILPRNGKCRGEIMREAMEFLRELVGDKLLLGCGVPMSSCLGLVDACRISCDVDLTYKGKIYNFLSVSNEILSAQHAINNSIFRRHLNGRAFMNDPDVFFLRNNNLKFTEEQKLLLAKINNLFGNVLFVSDNAGDYDEKQMALLKKFFRKTDEKVISAEYTDKENITIVSELDGKRKTFSFNIKKGKITQQ